MPLICGGVDPSGAGRSTPCTRELAVWAAWFSATLSSVRIRSGAPRFELFSSRDVVQPGRTRALGARRRWFKSSHPDHLRFTGK